MKLTSILALFLALFCSIPLCAQEKKPGQTVKEYDDYKNLTTVTLRPVPIAQDSSSELEFSTIFTYTGRVPSGNRVTMEFLSVSRRGLLYDRNRELTITVDAEIIKFGQIKRDIVAEYPNNSAFETVIVSVSFETLNKIANGPDVEGTLGQTKFKLPDELLAQLRTFIAECQKR